MDTSSTVGPDRPEQAASSLVNNEAINKAVTVVA